MLQAAAGTRPDVQIYGDDYSTPDRTCIRDYVHVIDLARAHILALGILGERSSIYNLGCGGDGYSVKEVIDTAREVTGRQINTRVGPRRAGDPAMLVASSEKIRRELGWEPKFQDLRVDEQASAGLFGIDSFSSAIRGLSPTVREAQEILRTERKPRCLVVGFENRLSKQDDPRKYTKQK